MPRIDETVLNIVALVVAAVGAFAMVTKAPGTAHERNTSECESLCDKAGMRLSTS
jgi:hypothetical protein